jgi:hypothetical protein
MKRVLSMILSAFSVFFLLFSPSFFIPELEKNIYTVREEKRQENFEGFLTLWHIADYPNSCRSQLNKCIKQIEKQNLHVFIDAESLSAKTAAERMGKGEFPDIISFSAGFLEDSQNLSELAPNDAILEKLKDTCMTEGKQYAYPYMVTARFPPAEEELNSSSRVLIYVQYIAFAKTEDQKKYELYEKFANLLLSEDMQKNLIKMNCVPVCNYPALYETEDNYSMVYVAITESLRFRKAFGG